MKSKIVKRFFAWTLSFLMIASGLGMQTLAVALYTPEQVNETVPEYTEETQTPVDEEADAWVDLEPDNDNLLLDIDQLSADTLQKLGLAAETGSKTEKRTLLSRFREILRGTDDENVLTIEDLRIRWITPSTGETEVAGTNLLVLRPDDDAVALHKFQIDFSIRSAKPHEPGDLEIVLPAVIWRDRDGNEAGVLTLSMPEEPGTPDSEYAWRRVGDNIVITNTRRIAGDKSIMLQGKITDLVAHTMQNGVYSEPLVVSASLAPEDGRTAAATSNQLQAQLYTYIEALKPTKSALYKEKTQEYFVYTSLDKAMDAGLPQALVPDDAIAPEGAPREGKDQYIYVRWYVTAAARGSQPFTLMLTDTPDPTDEHPGILLGFSGLEEKYYEPVDGVARTWAKGTPEDPAILYREEYSVLSKSAYVWTAYPRANFEDVIAQRLSVHNTVTSTVIGIDAPDSPSVTPSDLAEAKVTWPDDPTIYTVTKIWGDNDNEKGHRPSNQNVRIFKNGYEWKTVSLTAAGNWAYTWDDGGFKNDVYSVEEVIPLANGNEPGHKDTNGDWVWTHWYYSLMGTTEEWADAYHCNFSFTNAYGEVIQREHPKGLEPPEPDTDVKKTAITYTDSRKEATTDRLLNDLNNRHDVTLSYKITGASNVIQYTFTTEPGASRQLISNYSARPAKVVLTDDKVCFGQPAGDSSDGIVLQAGDYEIVSVKMIAPKFYRWDQPLNEEGERDVYKNWTWFSDVDNDACTELYGSVDQTTWVLYAVREGNNVTAKNGATVRGDTVSLPSGTLYFKMETTTVMHRVETACEVTVRLLYAREGTENTISGVLNAYFGNDDDPYYMEPVKNFCTQRIYEQTSDSPLTFAPCEEVKKVTATAYIHGRNYRVGTILQKSMQLVQEQNSASIKLETTGTLTQQSNITDLDVFHEETNGGTVPLTRSGVWYDLLPKGVTADLDSIRVENGEVTLAYTKENYKGSGRTLLIVRSTFNDDNITYSNYTSANPLNSELPRTGYKSVHTIHFDLHLPYTEVVIRRANGELNLLNDLAYEADEESIGTLLGFEGEPDDPTMQRNKTSALLGVQSLSILKDLDPNRDDPSFVYACADVNLDDVVLDASTGLRKYVSVDDRKWVDDPFYEPELAVYEGNSYSYSLRINASSGTTENIILFDKIERDAVLTDENVGAASWQGKLESIDVSQMVEKGANPVVYYCVDDIDLMEYEAMDGDEEGEGTVSPEAFRASFLADSRWSTTPPDDLGTVKAIAIDLWYRADGVTPFVLSEDDFLAAYLHMRAPIENESAPFLFSQDDPDVSENNAHAFNTLHCYSVRNEQGDFLAWSSYTKVGILPYRIEVTKIWDDVDNTDNIRPDTIKLHLYANGVDTGRDPLVLSQDDATDYNTWKKCFEHVFKYDEDGNWIEYTLVEEVPEGYTPTIDRIVVEGSTTSFRVTNTHELETVSVPFEKIWLDENGYTGDRPTSIKVSLLRDNVRFGQPKTVRAEDNWRGQFTGLQKYHNVTETHVAPNGTVTQTVTHAVPYTYTIEELSVYKYITELAEAGGSVQIKNRYYPYGDLKLEKKLTQSATQAAKNVEFTFRVFLTNEDGNPEQGIFAYKRYNAAGEEIGSGNVGNTGSIKLKGNEYAVIFDLPSETTYELVEEAQAGFTVFSSRNITGTIKANKTAEAEITNHYKAEGKLSLRVQKELQGKDQKRYQFAFSLNGEGIDQTAYTTVDRHNARMSEAGFANLLYNHSDVGKTYTYTVREVIPDPVPVGYTYDPSEYTVTVSIRDEYGNGKLTLDVSYKKGENSADALVFTNTYEAAGSFVPVVYKSVVVDCAVCNGTGRIETDPCAACGGTGRITARDPRDGEFSFTLYDKNGNPVSTASNDAEGAVRFDAISFTQDASNNMVDEKLLYVVKENAGSAAGVVYDTRSLAFEVSVLDNGDGTLSFNQTAVLAVWNAEKNCYEIIDGTAPEPVFYNRLKPGTLKVNKFTTHADGAVPNENETFRFKVRLSGETLPEKIEYTLSSIENDASLAGTVRRSMTSQKLKNTDKAPQASLTASSGARKNGPAPAGSEAKLMNGVDFRNTLLTASGDLTKVYHVIFAYTESQSANIAGLTPISVKAEDSAAEVYLYWDSASGTAYILSDAPIYANEDCSKMFGDDKSATSLRNLESMDFANFNTSRVTDMSAMFKFVGKTNTTPDLSGFDTSRVTNMSHMFYSCRMIIDFSSFNTSAVTDMSYMFRGYGKVPDLSTFDTSSVTDMSHMFDSYSGSSLDLSNFDTHNVTDMNHMFYAANKLGSLDLSSFDTSSVENMSYMFYGSYSFQEILTSLNISSFDTRRVTDMRYMFYGRQKITAIDVSHFDTSRVENMSNMFAECRYLTQLDVSHFDTRNVKSMDFMFYRCHTLSELDVSHFDTSSVEDMHFMFHSCANLEQLDVSHFDTSRVKNMAEMFSFCEKLTALDVSHFDTSCVENMSDMFSYCNALAQLDVSHFNTSSVTNMAYMFEWCRKLTALDVSHFDTSRVTNMAHMFDDCINLTALDVSRFDTSSVTNMAYMFNQCNKLTALDVSRFDTSSVTDMAYMFAACSALTALDVSRFDTSSVTSMEDMFQNCTKLKILDLSHFDTSKVTNMAYMFHNCNSLETLYIQHFDTHNVTDMSSMFTYCSSNLNKGYLDLSNFDTSNVTNMKAMFYGIRLYRLNLSSFDTTKVTNMQDMFRACSNLHTVYAGETFKTNNVTNAADMFNNCKKLVGGAGTVWNESLISDKSYARIDGHGGAGLFTGGVQLVSGAEFHAKLLSAAGSADNVKKIIFGTMDEFQSNVSSYTAVENVDVGTSGAIKLYWLAGSNTAYVLSQGKDLIFANENCDGMFKDLTSLEEINTGLTVDTYGYSPRKYFTFSTQNTVSMQAMFENCSKLSVVNFLNYRTHHVSNMRAMFAGCSSLQTLDLSFFNTKQVVDMQSMFDGCSSLTALDVTHFDTQNVTNMQFMFQNCSALTTLELRYFTGSPTITGMFNGCAKIKLLDLSGFTSTSVSAGSTVFGGCNALQRVRISNGYDYTSADGNGRFPGTTVYWIKELTANDSPQVKLQASDYAAWDTITDDHAGWWIKDGATVSVIHFNANGASGSMPDIVTDWYLATELPYPYNYTYGDNVFIGWKDEAKGVTYDPNRSIPANTYAPGDVVTLKAQWRRATYSIILRPGSHGTGDIIELNDISVSNTYVLPAVTFTADTSYHFTEWLDSNDNVYPDKATIPANHFANGDRIQLTAQWSADELLVQFAPNGGSGSMSPAHFSPTEDNVLPANSFYRMGYTFTGWLNTENNSVYSDLDTIPAGTYTGNQTITLTAQWEKLDTNLQLVDGEVTFTIRAGEQAAFAGLPAETSYEVYEETPAGWTLVSTYNANGQIPADGTVNADFVNDYSPGRTSTTITASKLLDGAPAENGAFSFVLTEVERPTGVTPAEAVTVQNGVNGVISFPAITYTSPGTYRYTITEINTGDPAISYDDTTEYVSVLVEMDAEGVLSASVQYDAAGADADTGAVFQNASRPGSLVLTKEELNRTDAAFTFHITLSNAAGSPISAVGYLDDNTPVSFNGENDAVTLGHGASVHIPGLPAGTQYTITEENKSGWTMISDASILSGTISPATESSVTVQNSYAASTFANLSAHKSLSGGHVERNQFTFVLTQINVGSHVLDGSLNASNGDEKEPMDETDTDPWNGTAGVRFDDITFTSAGDFAFKITENAGADANILYDTAVKYAWIRTTDNGDGTLTAAVKYSDGEESWKEASFWTGDWTNSTLWQDTEPLFVNSMKPGTLKVSKTLTGATDLAKTHSFSFVLGLADANDAPLVGTYDYTVYNADGTPVSAGTLSDGGSFALKGDQYMEIGLPHGTQYTVTEQTDVQGFALESKTGDTGTVLANETVEADFVNRYESSVSLVIPITKHFTGGLIREGQFSFTMTDAVGNTKTGFVVPDTADASQGTLNFTLDYTLMDDGQTFKYTITENVDENNDGVVYDTHREELTVSVADNGDGTMTALPVYDADGVVFENNKLFRLNVGKTVEGNMGDRSMAFPFTIILSQNDVPYVPGNLPGDWQTEAEGIYSFTLRHGQIASITLPADVKYSILEDAQGYAPAYQVVGTDGTELAKSTSREDGWMYMDGSFSFEKGDQTVSFTNTLNMAVPTNARLAVNGAAIVPICAVGLAFILVRRRRKRHVG